MPTGWITVKMSGRRGIIPFYIAPTARRASHSFVAFERQIDGEGSQTYLMFRKKRKEKIPVARQGEPQQQSIGTIEVEGRRYFHDPDATYMLPKDMADVPRLDFQHFLIRQAMHGNYISPLAENINTILDVGCGTGRWCAEMALAFPSAQVLGIDLEEMPLVGIEKPRNYLYKQANILNPLPFGNNAFDFVHQRLMLMSIPSFKWTDVLREILRVTQPGGWIELIEVGCTIIPQGPVTHRWYEWIRESSRIYNQDPDMPVYLARLAAEAGIKNIKEFHYDIPISESAGRLGTASLTNMRSFFDALRPRYITQLQIDPEAIHTMWAQLVEEWHQMQASIRYFVVCGQK